MSNPLQDRYEQILAEDPTSTAFVELAKVLLEQGDAARALAVCEQGISHHARSVVGRVLGGKALIQLGRPAEAMEQFDKAVGVDRDNPHAYNLIGEVLLQKGLYRSALPLLRKAVALQPDDGRVKQWLEQTQAALQGGPAPVLEGESLLASAIEQPSPPPKAPEPPQASAPAASTEQQGEATAPDGDAAERTVQASATELPGFGDSSPPEAQEQPRGPRLLMDLPTGETTLPDSPPESESSEPPSSEPPSNEADLLADVPSYREKPAALVQLPRVEVSPQAAAAIAKEYERELREKLQAQAEQKTFFQRHGAKIAVITVAVFFAGAFATAFMVTRAKNHGKDLRDALAFAQKSYVLDTAQGYRAGLDVLAQAVAMDSGSERAWALTAYGRAVLFAEHGGSSQDRTEAIHALEQPGVQEQFPGLALVARFYTADPREREAVRKTVLDSALSEPEVEELAGRLLIQRGDSTHALERFKRALQLSTNNVRALVALGNYYRESADYPAALEFYEKAAELSPQDAELVVGAAESRLSLWQDFATALEDLDKLPKKDELSPSLTLRREIAHARLVAANGNPQDAVRSLQELSTDSANRTLDLQLALGEVLREAGEMASAQKAYEEALKIEPKSEAAKEGLGHVLLARDHPKDLLARLTGDDGARKVLVVRAAAYARLGDWKHVRSELQRTQVKGKFPIDSVVYLALADAAEEKAEVAQTALEKTRASLKRSKPELSVALGTVYWQRGLLDRARAQFEDAMKDPLDYEGACSLGRLLEGTDAPDKAVEALERAVHRNGSHGEARHALGRLYLAMGRTAEGLKQAEALQLDNPDNAAAQTDFAFALLQAGRFAEADVVVTKALRLDGQDVEAHRVKAELLFERGNGRDAFAELEKANRLNAKDPETFCAIGRAFLRQGNTQNAVKAFEAALRDSASLACGKVGLSAAKLPGVTKGALKELGDVVEQASSVWDRAWAAATLAQGELAAGNTREARKLAEFATKLGPNLADGYFAAGVIALRAKDEGKGKEGLEKAVALEPTDAGFHLALADFLARPGQDASRAYSEYQLYLKLSAKSPNQGRVKKLLPALKKRLAKR